MDALKMISLLNTLFYVSMVVTFVGLGLTVFFFFYFDIRTIRLLMSGKGRIKSVRKVQERHAKTEGLRPSVHSGRSGEIRNRNVNAITEAVAHQQDEPVTGVLQTDVPETSVLNQESAETTFLNKTAPVAVQSVPLNIRFELTETTMVIHTDEII